MNRSHNKKGPILLKSGHYITPPSDDGDNSSFIKALKVISTCFAIGISRKDQAMLHDKMPEDLQFYRFKLEKHVK